TTATRRPTCRTSTLRNRRIIARRPSAYGTHRTMPATSSCRYFEPADATDGSARNRLDFGHRSQSTWRDAKPRDAKPSDVRHGTAIRVRIAKGERSNAPHLILHNMH